MDEPSRFLIPMKVYNYLFESLHWYKKIHLKINYDMAADMKDNSIRIRSREKIAARIIAALISLISLTFLPLFSQAQDFDSTNLSGDYYPYMMPPFNYENNFVLTVTFKTTEAVLNALVPEPLQPNDDHIMSISFVIRKMVKPERILYKEAFLSIPVTHNGDSGVYCPVRYMDDNDEYAGEREFFGITHFNATVEIGEVKNNIRGTVIRDGKPLVDLIFKPGTPIRVSAEDFPNRIYSLKVVPSITEGFPPAVKQLISIKEKNVIIENCRTGEARLYFDSLPTDPLGSIPIINIVDAKYYKLTYDLDYGKVVFDYLGDKDFRSQVSK